MISFLKVVNCGVIIILAYIYIAKTKILVSLSYRFEVFTGILANLILMIATVFFWKVAYKGIDQVSGVNLKQMITYSVIVALLGTIFTFDVENVINDRIRQGDIAMDFIKPVNVFALYFAQDVGGIISSFVQKFIPLLVFVMIFIGVPVPKSIPHFILFCISSIFSYLILWLMSAIVGVLDFWLIDLGPVGFIRDVIVRILSGSVIPIWFFPDFLQRIIGYTPFTYTYQLPAGIFIGKAGLKEGGVSIFTQLVWIFILFSLLYFMQARARKRLLVQGG